MIKETKKNLNKKGELTMKNTTVDFSVLNQEEPVIVQGMAEFYNRQSEDSGFPNVYTKEGYKLVGRLATGRAWYNFHKEMVEKSGNDVNYDTRISVYSEDYAMVADADVVAYTTEKEFLGRMRLDTTYIGASVTNQDAKYTEWKGTLNKTMSYVMKCMDLYEEYLNYKDSK